MQDYTRAVHKETGLFKIYYFTCNLIKLVSFKVLPSTLESTFYVDAAARLACTNITNALYSS